MCDLYNKYIQYVLSYSLDYFMKAMQPCIIKSVVFTVILLVYFSKEWSVLNHSTNVMNNNSTSV